ncbi:MAG: hypothetical protein ABWK01_05345 [Infirmifilum sp.]
MPSRVVLQARKALSEGRVKKVEIEGVEGNKTVELFIVESRERKKFYVVIPGLYCSCEDFLFSVFYRRRSKACYHMVAVDLVIKEGFKVKKEKMTVDDFYRAFLASL